MKKIEKLRQLVKELYEKKDPKRAEWADWLFANHVFHVAEKAGQLADEYGANREMAMAAGMLHDVADSVMSRFSQRHEEESLKMAKNILTESGFSVDESDTVVEDAIRCHSCFEGCRPITLEGKVMATADAFVHLTSDFYSHAAASMKDKKTPLQIRDWGLKKIDRDFEDKIFFQAVREEVKADHEKWKEYFRNL